MDGCRVGIGQIEITPTDSGPACGWGPPGRKKAKPPNDPDQRLFVTAIALEDAAKERVVLINADLHSGGDRLWRAAAEAAGLDRSRVIFCGTHTHGGPGQRYGGLIYSFATASPWVGRSTRRLATLVAAAASEAIAGLAPGGVAIGRQAVIDGGSNRAAPSWEQYTAQQRSDFFTAGPGALLADEPNQADRMRDPRVTVLLAAPDHGAPVGVLAWYAVHGNSLGPKWEWFGADLWGPARAVAESRLDGARVGFGGGSSGDITPRPMDATGELRDGSPGDERPDLATAIGSRVGAAVADLVPTMSPAGFSLSVGFEEWEPRRSGLESPRWGLSVAGGGVDGPNGIDRWNDVKAGIHAPRYRRRAGWADDRDHGQWPKLPVIAAFSPINIPLDFLFRLLMPRQVPLHVLRIGDHAFATVPGEPTTMTGWRIEQQVSAQAGTASASVIGFAGDYAGYWVTSEEFLEQRYEAASTIYGREASTRLIDRLAGLAAQVSTARTQ